MLYVAKSPLVNRITLRSSSIQPFNGNKPSVSQSATADEYLFRDSVNDEELIYSLRGCNEVQGGTRDDIEQKRSAKASDNTVPHRRVPKDCRSQRKDEDE